MTCSGQHILGGALNNNEDEDAESVKVEVLECAECNESIWWTRVGLGSLPLNGAFLQSDSDVHSATSFRRCVARAYREAQTSPPRKQLDRPPRLQTLDLLVAL